MKYYLTTLMVLGLLVTSAAEAQERRTDQPNTRLRIENSEVSERRAQQQDLQAKFKREGQEINNQRTTLTESIKERRVLDKETREEKKAEVKEALENATTQEEREAILSEAQKLRKENKERNSEFRNEVKEKTTDITKQRTEHVINRYNAVIGRSENITKRIAEKIAELNEAGFDTSEASTRAQEIENHLSSAQVSFDKAQEVHSSIDRETIEKEDFKSLMESSRAHLKESKEFISLAWQKAKETVTILKSLSLKNNQA